jgi:hypothetical protein
MAKMTATKNYRLFERSDKNRPLDLVKHKKLVESMKQYGFLSCFPIACCRNGDAHLIVKDGQHRLAIAESLGLPVFYVVEPVDFDVASINGTPRTWTLKDYAQNYFARGVASYGQGLEFAETHHLPIGTAFALLAGTTGYSNVRHDFESGKFRVKDRQWAERVAGVYAPLVAMSPRIRTSVFLLACMAVCRVTEFDAERLTRNAQRCREKLVPYSTRDAYLEMIEAVYNFGRKTLVGLKNQAVMAMRDRSAAQEKVRK